MDSEAVVFCSGHPEQDPYNLDSQFRSKVLLPRVKERTASAPARLSTIYEENDFVDEVPMEAHSHRALSEDAEVEMPVDHGDQDVEQSWMPIMNNNKFSNPHSFGFQHPMSPDLFYDAGPFQQRGWAENFPAPEFSGPGNPCFEHDYDFHGYSRHLFPCSTDFSGHAVYPGPAVCYPNNPYSQHNDEPLPFAIPYGPYFNLGSEYAFYPARNDWPHRYIQGPRQVIDDDSYHNYPMPETHYLSSVKGPAQFMLDNSMYCPKFVHADPDAYDHGLRTVPSYNDFTPAVFHGDLAPFIENQPVEGHTTNQVDDRPTPGVQAEGDLSGTSSNPSEHFPVLPDPANGGQSADFEEWKGAN